MRSGTSLLQHVLCTSPQANPFVHGCRYLTSQIAVYAQYAGNDHLYIDDYLGGREGLTNFTKDILDRLLQKTHHRLGRPDCLILKNPELSTYFPLAAALMPRARFIVSVRDPKDTIASMIGVGEKHRQNGVNSFLASAGRDVDKLCASYRQFYLPVFQSLQKCDEALKERVLFIRYESLIGDTEAVVERLSAFTGLALPAEDLVDQKAWRSRVNPESDDVYSHPRWSAYVTELSGGPISAASIGRYREALTQAEAEKIDRLCADVRRAFSFVQGGSA